MTTTTTIDQATAREMLESIFSDSYKDAHGFRPRHVDTSTMSDADLHEAIEDNVRYWQQEEQWEREAEEQARYDREAEIQHLMSLGAADRATAERWYAQARGC